MIKIPVSTLEEDLTTLLSNIQNTINEQETFIKKVSKAQSLWKSKGGSHTRKEFENIKLKLSDLCVYHEICNYCEQNEANDIEHVSPKSFFPEKTFVWENYILSCKQCNSGLKVDKCSIWHEDSVYHLRRGEQPVNDNILFVNPRTDDPAAYMFINMVTYEFELLPDLSNYDFEKATNTINVLDLNKRHALLKARRSAAIHYYEILERLIKILQTESLFKLKEILHPYFDRFDDNKSLEDLKEEIKLSYKNYIQSYQHPSVWYSIKTIESKTDLKWKQIFDTNPEFLQW